MRGGEDPINAEKQAADGRLMPLCHATNQPTCDSGRKRNDREGVRATEGRLRARSAAQTLTIALDRCANYPVITPLKTIFRCAGAAVVMADCNL